MTVLFHRSLLNNAIKAKAPPLPKHRQETLLSGMIDFRIEGSFSKRSSHFCLLMYSVHVPVKCLKLNVKAIGVGDLTILNRD